MTGNTVDMMARIGYNVSITRNTVTPMTYHAPGWTIDGPTHPYEDDEGDEYETGDSFQLWAPQDGSAGPIDSTMVVGEVRTHWAACWSPAADDMDPEHGFFAKGETLDEVMRAFELRPLAREAGTALRAAAEAWTAANS